MLAISSLNVLIQNTMCTIYHLMLPHLRCPVLILDLIWRAQHIQLIKYEDLIDSSETSIVFYLYSVVSSNDTQTYIHVLILYSFNLINFFFGGGGVGERGSAFICKWSLKPENLRSVHEDWIIMRNRRFCIISYTF